MQSSHQARDITLAPARKVLLPLVARAIHQMDELFLHYAGPQGFKLAKQVQQQWLNGGKTGPSALGQYAYALSTQLDDPSLKVKFSEAAEAILAQIRAGFTNF